VVLEEDVLDDSAIPTRNCYSHMVGLRPSNGTAHRILRNAFLSAAADLVADYAPTVEITGNRVVGGRNDGFAIGVESGPIRVAGLVFDLAGLLVGSALACTGNCSDAVVDSASLLCSQPIFVNSAGTAWSAFGPAPGRPLIDAGRDLIDVNGARPGRYEGSGPD